ncbi:thiamine pyrophosphate-dependent enzyme [Sphingobacterium endophyticum]|uniref:thiamine pyrophosphate-dependent enzyme n=1 Tax=Sphingobacterium endophyticum TaxID=2546448 RepID=UPI0012E0FCDF|nr:thiamine pyrophosphate-dependent enzyme [Sphingobacterium endophyticum]
MAQIVAEQLVEMLVEAGVKRVYAVTGDSLNYFNEAVMKDGRMKWIHVRHEEAGAYAATAEAELDGLACCAGSCGPGHVHLINGVYEAHRAHVPLIVIASTIPTHQMGMDYFQETNTYKLFDDCSSYNQLITTAEQAPRIIQSAIQHAISNKAVSVIGLPGDVSELKAKESITSTQIFRCNPIIRPNDNELKQIADLINKAKKITLYAGIGAIGAREELRQLAQKLKSPVGYSFRGKMNAQLESPFDIGMTGLLGIPSCYQAMKEAEVLILLGTDMPYDEFMPQDNKIIQIDTSEERLGRRCKLDIGAVGDIKETIKALLPLLNGCEDTAFLDSFDKFYKKVEENLHQYVEDNGSENAIQPEFVADIINTYASPNAIFTVDTGMTCVWGARYIHQTGDRKLLGSFNHGSMANAMPMAIGAALAHPERQVIAMSGDGGLSMMTGDLATIKQYNLPVKIIVFNNRALGMVKLEMQVAGLVDNQTDMINPDFAKLSEAYGIPALNIRKPEEVSGAISEALRVDGPFLLNIFTNPSALAMPSHITPSQVMGMTESMSKLILGGRMDEVFDTIKSNYKHLKGMF